LKVPSSPFNTHTYTHTQSEQQSIVPRQVEGTKIDEKRENSQAHAKRHSFNPTQKKASSKLKRNTIPHHHLSCNDDSKSGSGVSTTNTRNK